MATTLETVRAEVKNITGTFPFFTGENEVGDGVIDQSIQQAINNFSRDVPRTIVESEVGDGGKYYPLSTLTSWEDDFSLITAIDYDAGDRITGDELPQFLSEDNGDWQYYRNNSTRYFVLPNHSPAATITMMITYTARHSLDSTSSTIPTQYEKAVVYLSVAELASTLSFHAEKAIDPPAGASYISMRNKSSGFRSVGDHFREKYIDELGGEGVVGASFWRDFDQEFATGENYFYHNYAGS
tara:strand:- start:550 stop:1272 length:723 start_codon:yes stop_codon:yes gene_type:complete